MNSDEQQPKESLILRERCQSELFLFDAEPPPPINRAKPKFNCDGERLFRDRPDVYRAVVRALAIPGVSGRLICQTYHLSPATLRAIRSREAIPLDEQRQILLRNFADGAMLATDRVIEELPAASVKDATLAANVFCDKMLLLSGQPTERVDHVHHVDLFSDFKDFVKDLEAREVEARVIEPSDAPAAPPAALSNGEPP